MGSTSPQRKMSPRTSWRWPRQAKGAGSAGQMNRVGRRERASRRPKEKDPRRKRVRCLGRVPKQRRRGQWPGDARRRQVVSHRTAYVELRRSPRREEGLGVLGEAAGPRREGGRRGGMAAAEGTPEEAGPWSGVPGAPGVGERVNEVAEPGRGGVEGVGGFQAGGAEAEAGREDGARLSDRPLLAERRSELPRIEA